jgi:hypothetical protein
VADVVLHVVHQEGHGDFQSGAALFSNFGAFTEIEGLFEGDAGFIVAGGAPAVSRVRLADVDGDELDAIAKALVQFFQDPKLGSIGTSGEAAEDEHDGFFAAELAERHLLLAVVRL